MQVSRIVDRVANSEGRAGGCRTQQGRVAAWPKDIGQQDRTVVQTAWGAVVAQNFTRNKISQPGSLPVSNSSPVQGVKGWTELQDRAAGCSVQQDRGGTSLRAGARRAELLSSLRGCGGT